MERKTIFMWICILIILCIIGFILFNNFNGISSNSSAEENTNSIENIQEKIKEYEGLEIGNITYSKEKGGDVISIEIKNITNKVKTDLSFEIRLLDKEERVIQNIDVEIEQLDASETRQISQFLEINKNDVVDFKIVTIGDGV